MKQETKQTAVEWLIEEIRQRMITIHREPKGPTREVMILNLDMDLEKFKEMEKEQNIKFAYDFYYNFSIKMGIPLQYISLNRDNAEQYYEQTYGGNK